MATTVVQTNLQLQYLTFFLGAEEYAISILQVKEIIEYNTVTTVPRMPKWVRGVINLRGAVVPVIDLALKFGLEQRAVTKTTCIVILETRFEKQNLTIGVLADSVNQVMDLTADEIRPVPEFGTRVAVDYLLGMALCGKKFVLLLDADKILSGDELSGIETLSPGEGVKEPGNSAALAAPQETPDSQGDPEPQTLATSARVEERTRANRRISPRRTR
jgi:purine-binding chemotaxis protein CheW